MSRLTRDSRGQILRHVRGQVNDFFPCSADHEQDWQLYPVDAYSAIIYDDHTYIHIHILIIPSIHIYIMKYTKLPVDPGSSVGTS